MKYTSKQDAINKGLGVKDGRIYKFSVLETWYNKGHLDYKNSKYSAQERLEYGLRLAFDFQIINRANLRSGYIKNSKIDKTDYSQSVSLLDVMQRYNDAIRAIPSEFWPIVRKICIEDTDLVFPKNVSDRQNHYFSYLSRIDLCRGLDRVIESYTKKLKINQNGN